MLLNSTHQLCAVLLGAASQGDAAWQQLHVLQTVPGGSFQPVGEGVLTNAVNSLLACAGLHDKTASTHLGKNSALVHCAAKG